MTIPRLTKKEIAVLIDSLVLCSYYEHRLMGNGNPLCLFRHASNLNQSHLVEELWCQGVPESGEDDPLLAIIEHIEQEDRRATHAETVTIFKYAKKLAKHLLAKQRREK